MTNRAAKTTANTLYEKSLFMPNLNILYNRPSGHTDSKAVAKTKKTVLAECCIFKSKTFFFAKKCLIKT